MWLVKTHNKLFYGTDADLVCEKAQKHEWKEFGHSASDVAMDQLTSFVSSDWRPAVRVYTEEEKRRR